MDQTGDGFWPVQSAAGARAGGQIAAGEAVQSPGDKSLCALQGIAPGEAIQPGGTGSGDGAFVSMQSATGDERAGGIAGVAADAGADCGERGRSRLRLKGV